MEQSGTEGQEQGEDLLLEATCIEMALGARRMDGLIQAASRRSRDSQTAWLLLHVCVRTRAEASRGTEWGQSGRKEQGCVMAQKPSEGRVQERVDGQCQLSACR